MLCGESMVQLASAVDECGDGDELTANPSTLPTYLGAH